MIASTLNEPLVRSKIGEQVHILNIDLYKFYPIGDTIVYNNGALILENCDVYAGEHAVFQSPTGHLEIRGDVKILDQ